MLPEKQLLIKKELVEYGVLIESMIENVMQGLLAKDALLLERTIQESERQANELELEIDEHCIALIAQFQPKAKDLRTVLMVLGMNKDLERMGDHAVNIAQSAQYLIDRPLIEPFHELPRMGALVREMLQTVLNAFVNEDKALCQKVCASDDEVDALRTKIIKDLVLCMSNDPQTIERALHILRISSNLERIADLTTNIAEEVMYMAAGRILKHHHEG